MLRKAVVISDNLHAVGFLSAKNIAYFFKRSFVNESRVHEKEMARFLELFHVDIDEANKYLASLGLDPVKELTEEQIATIQECIAEGRSLPRGVLVSRLGNSLDGKNERLA